MPDYDETTDPAYRGDAEITARVEEDAATRAELDHDQADELIEVGKDILSRSEPGAAELDHGNSGPGGPLEIQMCSWGVISRGGLATMAGACILSASHPVEDGHLILGTDGHYYRTSTRVRRYT